MNIRLTLVALSLITFAIAPACSCGAVGSEDEARIAYLGVDDVVTKSLELGFAGFGAGDNANIPAQNDSGEESGTIDVTGQVDQGASDNKGMRLDVVLVQYSDGTIDDPDTDDEEEIAIVYDTAEGAPLDCDLSLRDFPDGTYTGTLLGTVLMSGDLEGELELSVAFEGEIDDDGAGNTVRSPGTTTVTGKATSPNGEFDIDTTI
jgi:hypothetical protein